MTNIYTNQFMIHRNINIKKLTNNNKTPENLKQTTVKKGKYRLATTQQQKANGQKQTNTLTD